MKIIYILYISNIREHIQSRQKYSVQFICNILCLMAVR